MKRLAALAAAILCTSCAMIAPPAKSGSVDHVVLVWLKRPGDARDRKLLVDLSRELRSIPGIRSIDSGTALQSDRPIVDDSFDIGYVMRFDSAAALESYATHPIHLRAKQQLSAVSRKILVYDVTR